MKVAGIDVHKKVLMVVVVDASTLEEKPSAAIRHHAERVAPPVDVVAGAGSGRGGDGIDCSVLAVGVAGTGAPYAFALGAGVFEPCSTWA